jgi:hypothetical protein
VITEIVIQITKLRAGDVSGHEGITVCTCKGPANIQ